jgi:hypothetical protein
MIAGKYVRWGCIALLATAAVALTHEAAADHRLFALVDNTNLNCTVDPSGNLIFGEAWGQDGFGTRQCEAISWGGTAQSRCPVNATQHIARIDTRNPQTFALTGTVYAQSAAPQIIWTSASNQLSWTNPNNCGPQGGNGGTYYVVSQGFEVPGGVP